MKKLYLKLNNQNNDYWYMEQAFCSAVALSRLPKALSKYHNDFDMNIDIISHKNQVVIWAGDLIKNQTKLEFATWQEKLDFDQAYEKYFDKRYEEIPKLRISLQNWKELQKKWEQLQKSNFEYVMFTLDDSEVINVVDVVGKNEITDQEWTEIKQDHEQFMRYRTAQEAYRKSLADYDYEWRGPQDDEYEADFMKFYK
jgi:hypothetical protein